MMDTTSKITANAQPIKGIQKIIEPDEFNKILLWRILNHINSMLDTMHSVADYNGISELVSEDTISRDIKEASQTIIERTLRKNQDIKENYLGIKLLLKIKSQLDKSELNKVKNLINTNDNKNSWSDNIVDKLKKDNLWSEEQKNNDEK